MRKFIDKFSQLKTLRPARDNVDWNYYWNLGIRTVRDLETTEGILASGRNEIYGAIFGRDSLITSLKLLKVYQHTKEEYLLGLVKKVLLTLANLQGREINIESGEEPGKCIHEYRPEKHEHLTRDQDKPWFIYPDNSLRNYDSIDATSLFLITLYRYYQITQDQIFLKKIQPNAEAALDWILNWADSNGDGFIDYGLKAERKSGGLVNQNWMDSSEATFHEDGLPVIYPLAPVEAQAYTYLAMRLWGNYFTTKNHLRADQLFAHSYQLKEKFNDVFVIKERDEIYLASGVDHNGKLLKSVRSSMGHTLWAALNLSDDEELEGILKEEYVESVVKRLLKKDIFEPQAGIRTLSKLSSGYDPHSYHNGSIWPHDNSMIVEGFENFGFISEAILVKKALLKAYAHFKTPIELFVFDHTLHEYLSPSGQAACRQQAWSAASILRMVAKDYSERKRLSIPYTMLNSLTSKAMKWLFVFNN